MSSHHIVREKQEPALLILGMDNFDDEYLGQLLEWSPTVMATEFVAEKLDAYGIKVDWILSDNNDGDIQSDVKTLLLNNEQPSEAGLNYLIINKYPAVNIVTDEFILTDYMPYVAQINLVIFCDNQKIYPVTSGFSKWKAAGEIITILSSADNLQLSGLKWLKENQYQTMGDGLFYLQFGQPFLFISEGI